MAISKERIVYISVLGLGLAALAGDRLFATGPASASAAEQAVASAADGAPAPVAARAGAPTGFPERLRNKAVQLPNGADSGADSAPDAFLIPAQWLPAKPVATKAAPEVAQAAADQAKSREFADQFTLSSVMGSADRGFVAAVINKTLINLGDRFDLQDGRAVKLPDDTKDAKFLLLEIAADHVEVRVLGDNSSIPVQLKSDALRSGRIETSARPPQPAKTPR